MRANQLRKGGLIAVREETVHKLAIGDCAVPRDHGPAQTPNDCAQLGKHFPHSAGRNFPFLYCSSKEVFRTLFFVCPHNRLLEAMAPEDDSLSVVQTAHLLQGAVGSLAPPF